MSVKPLKPSHQLCIAKNLTPTYSIKIKNKAGEEVTCTDPSANRTLVALMDLAAVNGGAACHWGGPAASAEVLSALHEMMFKEEKWFDHYNFVNDIGHAENGVYALRANYQYGGLTINDLKGFRSIESKLTGHGESHLYPEGVLLSNGPLASGLAQTQGLAMADKLLGNNRKTICMLSDGASMEGEAKEAFAAIPGLFKKGKMNPYILLLSDNDTKLSGRITEDSFDMNPTFATMEALGWKTIVVENGNDLEACYHALEDAMTLSNEAPVLVWLKTTKGFGVKSTEESKSGGHGFPLKAFSADIHDFIKELWTNGELPSELTNWANELTQKPESNKVDDGIKREKMQAGFARAAINAAKEGKPIVSISCDLQGSTGMAPFHKEFPDLSFDIGIAESNMVSCAAGLSKLGYIPVVDTFAAFGVTKGNLPLIMAALSQCPMIAVFSHTGFQDAADGASHQSLTYLSAVSSIPYTKVVVVGSSEEAEKLMTEAINDIELCRIERRAANSYIFFVGRENFPATLNQPVEMGKPQILADGKDGVILTCGPMIYQALAAKEELKAGGIDVAVVNNHAINFADVDQIQNILNERSNKLVTIEDHQEVGGMGAQIVQALMNKGHDFKARTIGVKGHFGQSAYTAGQLYEKNGLNVNEIAKAFHSF